MTGSDRNATCRNGSANVTPMRFAALRKRIERFAHVLVGQIAHQSGDGKCQFGQHLAVGHHHEPTLDVVQSIDRCRHVDVLDTDDADVVAVVSDR